jgi:hypothetical protein
LFVDWLLLSDKKVFLGETMKCVSVYTRRRSGSSAKGNGVQEEEIERVISARAPASDWLCPLRAITNLLQKLLFSSLLYCESFLDAHLFLNRLLK